MTVNGSGRRGLDIRRNLEINLVLSYGNYSSQTNTVEIILCMSVLEEKQNNSDRGDR